MSALTFLDVSCLLRADPETGRLYWLERPTEMFKTERNAKSWNARYAGKEAFTTVGLDGYKEGAILNKPHRAHRVMWLLCTGSWPRQQVDHINGDRGDNRFSNLREASNAENARNQKKRSDNTSGSTGVYWAKRHGKWLAQVRAEGKDKYLGLFDEFEDAVASRKTAEEQYGYHDNHGRPL